MNPPGWDDRKLSRKPGQKLLVHCQLSFDGLATEWLNHHSFANIALAYGPGISVNLTYLQDEVGKEYNTSCGLARKAKNKSCRY